MQPLTLTIPAGLLDACLPACLPPRPLACLPAPFSDIVCYLILLSLQTAASGTTSGRSTAPAPAPSPESALLSLTPPSGCTSCTTWM